MISVNSSRFENGRSKKWMVLNVSWPGSILIQSFGLISVWTVLFQQTWVSFLKFRDWPSTLALLNAMLIKKWKSTFNEPYFMILINSSRFQNGWSKRMKVDAHPSGWLLRVRRWFGPFCFIIIDRSLCPVNVHFRLKLLNLNH